MSQRSGIVFTHETIMNSTSYGGPGILTQVDAGLFSRRAQGWAVGGWRGLGVADSGTGSEGGSET